MNTFKAIEIGDKLSLLCVEDYQLVSIHVSDIEPMVFRIETLIVEPHRWSRHWNIGHLFQHLIPRGLSLCKRDVNPNQKAEFYRFNNALQILNYDLHRRLLSNIRCQNLNSTSICMRRGGRAATAWPKKG